MTKVELIVAMVEAFGRDATTRFIAGLPRADRDALEAAVGQEGMNAERRRQEVELRSWVENLPPECRALADEFPPGFLIHFLDGDAYVVGYVDGRLIRMSRTSPADDYDLSLKETFVVDMIALRAAVVKPN